MTHFTPVNDLPVLDLNSELNRLIDEKILHWNENNSICINTTPENPTDYEFGTGSLTYDWKNSYRIKNEDGTMERIVPELSNPKKEKDFTVLCEQLKGTLFEEVYQALKSKYADKLGRIRLMKMKPKTCLSWHNDDNTRLHYPMITAEGCLMIIGDEVKHMPANTWWHTDTIPLHTALNASQIDRIHLVCSIVDDES
jgi:hypothetical protein